MPDKHEACDEECACFEAGYNQGQDEFECNGNCGYDEGYEDGREYEDGFVIQRFKEWLESSGHDVLEGVFIRWDAPTHQFTIEKLNHVPIR